MWGIPPASLKDYRTPAWGRAARRTYRSRRVLPRGWRRVAWVMAPGRLIIVLARQSTDRRRC